MSAESGWVLQSDGASGGFGREFGARRHGELGEHVSEVHDPYLQTPSTLVGVVSLWLPELLVEIDAVALA